MKTALVLCALLSSAAVSALAGETPVAPVQQDAASAPTKADIEATWKTACEWGVGSAAERVRAARKKMVEYGRPGLDHVLTRLASEDGLELESVQAVVEGFGAEAAVPLLDAVENEKGELALRQGLHLLGVIRKKIDAPTNDRACGFILSQTSSETLGVKLRALLIASEYGLRAAIPAAVSLAGHDKEGVRRGIAQILGKFGGNEAVAPLVAMLRDPLMTVRFPAQYSLAQCGAAAAPDLIKATAAEKDPIARNHLIMALGATGAEEAPAAISLFLKSDDAVCRGLAVRAISNWLEARQAAWKAMADGPAKPEALENLKQAAQRLRALLPDDPNHFVRAQIDELGRAADSVAALKAEEKK